MSGFAILLMWLLALVCFQAAALGWLVPAYRAMKKGHFGRKIVIIPSGYKPELDKMPPQNHDMIFMTRDDYNAIHPHSS